MDHSALYVGVAEAILFMLSDYNYIIDSLLLRTYSPADAVVKAFTTQSTRWTCARNLIGMCQDTDMRLDIC